MAISVILLAFSSYFEKPTPTSEEAMEAAKRMFTAVAIAIKASLSVLAS